MEGTDVSNGSHILKILGNLTATPSPAADTGDVTKLKRVARQTVYDCIMNNPVTADLSYRKRDKIAAVVQANLDMAFGLYRQK